MKRAASSLYYAMFHCLAKSNADVLAGTHLPRGVVHVPHTKTGIPLELPITRQLAAILEWRRSETGGDDWVFPSPASRSGHVAVLTHLYAAISREGGRKFWFHGFRNCLITIADRELTLPRSLTKRLVNHARPTDVTEGYAADWTIGQLRGPAQLIADRIDEILEAGPECEHDEHRMAQPAPPITTRPRQRESAHPV